MYVYIYIFIFIYTYIHIFIFFYVNSRVSFLSSELLNHDFGIQEPVHVKSLATGQRSCRLCAVQEHVRDSLSKTWNMFFCSNTLNVFD